MERREMEILSQSEKKTSHGSEKRKEQKKVEGGTEGKQQIKLENLKNMK